MDKPGAELDKFKRRLIRAVARLLLQEKKSEEEIFKELKKETGCDCELLWTRMRALTLKKLDRLLFADDRMDAVPKPARMSLTDWLLFDLVLVHQKVDLIGQNSSKTKDLPALVELFELVKMFKLESLDADKLVDAWSLATLSYNNKGHHCSPMLLQRRWYQLKEVTRTKFYEYWYAYRGSVQRVSLSEPYKPSPLQTEIARHFKLLIIKPMDSWEELIQQRKIIMPDEFEKKMKERVAMRTSYVPPKPSDDVPDLVMIEPNIETIDLGQQSDDNETEEDKQEEEGGVPVPPLVPIVRIKQEPLDDINIDETQVQSSKKSIYEVVLESTALENEQIDSIDADDLNTECDDTDVEEIEETPVGDKEDLTLPQISNVFGNVSVSVLANIEKDRADDKPENTEVCDNNDHTYVDNDKNADVDSQTIVLDDVDDNARDNDTHANACEIIVDNSALINKESDDNSAQNKDKVSEVSDNDKNTDVCGTVEDISDNIGKTSPGDGNNINIHGDINIISDDEDDMSGKADASLTGKVDETNVVGKVDETNVVGKLDEINVVGKVDETNVVGKVDENNVVGKVDETNVVGKVAETIITGNIVKTTITHNVGESYVSEKDNDASKLAASENETIVNAQINFPTIVAALNAPTISSTVTESPSKDVEIIDTPSHPLIIIPSDDDDDVNTGNNVVKTGTSGAVGDIIRPRSTIDQSMEVDSTPAVLDTTSPDTLKVELKGEAKTAGDTKPGVTGFNFGELPHDISFVDDGIEFVDDGIVYVDEDAHDGSKIKNEEGNEDEDTPKIDSKLLMCPIVYTSRLDDMYMFHRQPFDHVTDKHLLDDIAKKSKPVKQERNEKVENVTINYIGENIESVTVNNTKTVEHVQKTVSVIENVSVNNDNIVIMKKEPVNVNSEINADVENNPENDGNVTSDDDDCVENVIDDSQRVKTTSYLLQRPRSRRYNPIQLCKNPDFNTRLKRLSVGFFSSPRNRVLIKSCKPLTIDLSKAFESKLISGTLYLKPADENVVTEIVDDTQSQNVSVLPSALPAQSLIDNSKATDIIPMLRQCLEASKQPIQPQVENVPTTTERNKIINLPDITEIRRINQRLLTAEVTPIQVHNNEPQVPVTIVTTLNTPTSTPQTTVTIPETEQDRRSMVSVANDARGPPKLLDITDDYPTKSNQQQQPTTGHSYNNTHTSTGRNAFDTLRPRFHASAPGRPPRMQNGKRFFPQKLAIWKPRHFRPEIPWLSRSNEATKVSVMTNETLLTLDALNKMLFLLTKNLGPVDIEEKNTKPKGKRKSSAQQMKQPRGQQKTNSDDSCVILVPLVPTKEGEANEIQNTCSQKPKINIKSATNYPPYKEKVGEKTEKSKKKVKYCCWAKQRMLQMLFCRRNIPKHECPRVCVCCCRHLLADYIMHDKKIKSAAEQKIKKAVNAYGITEQTVVSEGTQTVEENIENPVQTSAQVPHVETVPEDTVIVDVDDTSTETTTKTAVTIENEPIAIEDLDDDVPPLGGEVSVKTTVLQPQVPRGIAVPVTVRRSIVALPIKSCPKDTNYVLTRDKPKAGKPAYRVTRCISADKQSGGIVSILPTNTTETPSTTIVPTLNSPPSLSKLLTVKKSKTPNRLKTIMPPPLLNKPFVPPKNFKEKMIFLNSKQISEKPTASPVFLGKNKILLTTVKFPPNLKLFQESKKILRSSLDLPTGVHLILLADGTVSYKIDQDMEVNAMDIAEIPTKIAALQEHMYLHGAQEQVKRKLAAQNAPVAPATVESEIVDLVNDDDESVSTVKDHQNTENPVVTNVQITEKIGTINSNDSPDVSLYYSKMDTSKKTEHDPAYINMNSNVNTETESNLNETTDQCTVIDIQEDVQETNQNQMVSASTEPVQSHPSIEKVNAEIGDHPNPSSQTDRTVVPEVSAGQVQDQPKPSGQNFSTEALRHPEPATQNVSEPATKNVSEPATQNVSEPATQNVSEPATQNVNEPATQNVSEPPTQNLSTEKSEEGRSKPSKPKTKNILSDLMEMSGIFDEDMTLEAEEAVPAQPVEQVTGILAQASSVSPLPAPVVMAPPTSTKTSIIVPSLFDAENHIPPKVSTPLGELSPITSLYELKYACANNGVFFKLDFDTGYLVPINVCMKPAQQKPTLSSQIAPKSVIDLTDDDDKQEKDNQEQESNQEQPEIQLVISPTKRSLLLVNNTSSSGFSGPVKPVKLFKALKPNILKRLSLSKIERDSVNPLFDKNSVNHTIKRKQFLKSINMNANLNVNPVRRYFRKNKDPYEAVQEPKLTKSDLQPVKQFATTILSDDDSSDDEPLAKIAKRKNENANAPEEERDTSGSVVCYRSEDGKAPVADVEPEASVEKQIESEFPAADSENNLIDCGVVNKETPVEEQNESEPAIADTEPVYMSEDEIDFTDQDTPFGIDLNENDEEEDCCILGV